MRRVTTHFLPFAVREELPESINADSILSFNAKNTDRTQLFDVSQLDRRRLVRNNGGRRSHAESLLRKVDQPAESAVEIPERRDLQEKIEGPFEPKRHEEASKSGSMTPFGGMRRRERPVVSGSASKLSFSKALRLQEMYVSVINIYPIQFFKVSYVRFKAK